MPRHKKQAKKPMVTPPVPLPLCPGAQINLDPTTTSTFSGGPAVWSFTNLTVHCPSCTNRRPHQPPTQAP